jgi:hypothetical protein
MILWIVLIIISGISGNSCPIYRCKLLNDYFSPEVCLYYDNSSITPAYYGKVCLDDQRSYCSPTIESNSTCEAPPNTQGVKYPGEKCHYNTDCNEYSIRCENQLCLGRNEGEDCKSHAECSPGLRCSSTCTRQIETGQGGCYTDYDCVNYSGCDILQNSSTPGKCIEYWSLPETAAIKSCINNTNFLCASSTCSGTQCIPAVQSGQIPNRCYTDQDCTNNSEVPGKCLCGKNRNANMYCGLFYGDFPYQNYFSILKSWHQTAYLSKCNTVRRFSYVCAGDYWDRKQAYNMNYYYYNSFHFPDIIEFDDCIGQIYLSDYVNTIIKT